MKADNKNSGRSGSGGAIIQCNCRHEQQDRIYGKNNRFANNTKTANEYRCTVCGSVKK